MDFKLVLPGIYINFDIQTKFEVNQTQIGYSIGFKIFFGGLNQKSAIISMCKIHINNDSESFRQIH